VDEEGKRDLDKLWLEFGFYYARPTAAAHRLHLYERAESGTLKRWGAEFDVFRSEDKDITSEAKLQKFAEMYLAKARNSFRDNGGDEIAMKCWTTSSKR